MKKTFLSIILLLTFLKSYTAKYVLYHEKLHHSYYILDNVKKTITFYESISILNDVTEVFTISRYTTTYIAAKNGFTFKLNNGQLLTLYYCEQPTTLHDNMSECYWHIERLRD